MDINEKILEVLDDFKINKDNAICYLLSLYYSYKPDYIPDIFKQKMNITGIYSEDKGSIKWNIGLFDNQQTAFEWVKTEYIDMFKQYNSKRTGHLSEATILLKSLFAKNPELRKEDVMSATKLYLNNTEPAYIMFPHYFIQKGRGLEKTETILTWLSNYKELKEYENGKESITNTIQ